MPPNDQPLQVALLVVAQTGSPTRSFRPSSSGVTVFRMFFCGVVAAASMSPVVGFAELGGQYLVKSWLGSRPVLP